MSSKRNMMICPRCWNKNRPCDKCEDTGYVPNVQLSDNFTLWELVRSNEAMTRGIPNDPIVRELDRLREMCQRLVQKVRNAKGLLTVTSGFRSLALNRAVKGSPTSAHPAARAMDVVPKNCSLTDLMHWFADTDIGFDQAILEPGWVHIGYKHPTSGQQRRQLLQKYGPGDYRVWRP